MYVLRGTTFRCAKRRRVIRDLPASGPLLMTYADVAQLAEQLICNQQVIGSSPIIGLCDARELVRVYRQGMRSIPELVMREYHTI